MVNMMFAYSFRKDRPILLRFCMFISWHQEEILERSELNTVFWIHLQVRVISLAQKLSTIEEWHKENYSLWWGDYRNRGYKPENCTGFRSR